MARTWRAAWGSLPAAPESERQSCDCQPKCEKYRDARPGECSALCGMMHFVQNGQSRPTCNSQDEKNTRSARFVQLVGLWRYSGRRLGSRSAAGHCENRDTDRTLLISGQRQVSRPVGPGGCLSGVRTDR